MMAMFNEASTGYAPGRYNVLLEQSAFAMAY
jgi:hypothetical protein